MAEPGQLIGPYRLQKRLGRGAMGEVWRARDERLDRLVAMKLLPTGHVSTPEKRGQMLREAKAAAGVPHPNVVTLYDIFSEDDRDYLVMELVDGETLSDAIKAHGALPPQEATFVMEAVMGALAAAHGRGILHRDIKSANIMRMTDGTVKVLDFGLAKLRESDLEAAGIGSGSAKPLALDDSIELDATLSPRALAESQAADADREAVGESAMPTTEMILPGMSDTSLPTQKDSSEPYVTPSGPLGTIAGDLIGTPLYMSPEQVLGDKPDTVSEVFTVGVVAYELLAGKPPYSARTLNDLFVEIDAHEFPPLPDSVPAELKAWVAKATAKERAERYPSMAEALEALQGARQKLFGARSSVLKLAIPAALLAAVAAGMLVFLATRAPEAPPERPGDKYVTRALEEYDVFYGKKAISSLRAAIKNNPNHPRAYAYLILFGGVEDSEREAVVKEAQRIQAALPSKGDAAKKDRALLQSAVALATEGPAAARAALSTAGASVDRELDFWNAELAFRAGEYDLADAGFEKLLANDAKTFRGRIYDHYSAVLLYFGKAQRAVEIGKLYSEAFPGEADAVGVYATTLSAAGKHDQALRYAREALNLNEGEDTLAGLGKVYAQRGERKEARDLYRRSMNTASPERRVMRRAALALLHLVDSQQAEAEGVISPCLPGGDDSDIKQRGACLWVAGLVFPDKIPVLVDELETLAAADSPMTPAYGKPKTLANLLRARAQFFAGGCVLKVAEPPAAPASPAQVAKWLESPADFYAAYHVPFYREWAGCELKALGR